MYIRVGHLSILWYVIVRFFFIKTIILCKVIQGHLGAKKLPNYASFYNNFQ